MNKPRQRRRRHPRPPHTGPGQPGSGQNQPEGAPIAPAAPLGPLGERCYKQIPRVAIAHGEELVRTGRVSEPQRVGDTLTLFVRGSGVSFDVVFDFSQLATNLANVPAVPAEPVVEPVPEPVVEPAPVPVSVAEPAQEGSQELLPQTEAVVVPLVTPAVTPITESILGKCTCPYYQTGGLCKHLWAGILQIDQAGLGTVVPGVGPLKVAHENPRAPGERRVFQPKLPTPVVQPRHPTTSWLSRLEQIQGPPRSTLARRSLLSSQAYFVINAPETIATGKLILDLWTRDRTSNGDYGQLRPSKVSRQDLSRFEDVQDQEIISVLGRTGEPQIFTPFSRIPGAVSSRFTVDPLLESYLLPLLAGAGKIFLSRSPNGSPDNTERPLKLDRGNPWELELKVETANAEYYKLDGYLKRDAETRDLKEPHYIFRNGFILFSDRISRVSDPRHIAWLTALRSPQEFLVPKDQGDTLLKQLLTNSNAPKLTWPAEMGWSLISLEPRPMGVFRALGNDPATGRMTLTVNFDYAGRQVALDDLSRMLVDLEQKKVYTRNLPSEDHTLRRALEILRDRQGTGTIPTEDLNRAATELSREGWSVFVENQKLSFTDDFAMNVSSGTDWFDLKMQASFGGKEVGQAELLHAMAAKDGIVKLSDGTFGMLPQEWLDRYEVFKNFGKKTADGSIRFSKAQGMMLNAVLGDIDRVKGDSGFTSFREKVQKFEGLKIGEAPQGFKGELRNYQNEGLSWLCFLEEFEIGGILADDMGLGKTIQILAFLQSRVKKTGSPSIVVAPKSLVFNWLDEAKKFVPDLKVVRYSGAGRGEGFEDMKGADLVITTYGTLRADIEKLKTIKFDVAIVDEAQAIKNAKSQSSQACKELNASHRLALTGTPIENSIHDLFSILQFTSPGLLDMSNNNQGGTLTAEAQAVLTKMIRPFLLRRTKEKVLQELPEKSEQVLYCEMSVKEKKFYNALRDHYKASLEKSIETNGLGGSQMHILEALLRLRQAACHGGLVDKSMKDEPSAKLLLLLNHIKEVISEGHKALVFSQFTSLLALVRDSLDQEEIVYEYLDGKTNDRKKPVERFQTDPDCRLFLISLKAGGTGLNLTAADYVFILDPWWNPAVEAQAIGRAHRMGQVQKVFAYRMIARGTVEEKIIDLQKTKRDLAESIISEDQDFFKKMTREDLQMLLT